MKELKQFLEHKAYNMRLSSLIMTAKAGSGHPTSCLSAADLVAAIFFYAMHFDPKHSDNPNNDRFILSKGHASPILYAVWKELGQLTEDDLLTYRNIDSNLEGHPTLRFPYAEAATGSLGMGLSIGAGMAFASRISPSNPLRQCSGQASSSPLRATPSTKLRTGLRTNGERGGFYTYVLLGDSEIAEGSIWEAVEIAAYYKLNNLVGVLDCNRLGQSTETFHGHHVERYAAKFEAFGWKTFVIDGHDMVQIMGALDKACEVDDRPTMIIAKTLKGHGVSMVEDKLGFHGQAFKPEQMNEALKDLEEHFPDAASYKDEYEWKPQIPEGDAQKPKGCVGLSWKDPQYKKDEKIPTRKVYGQTLTQLGDICDRIVSLDGEVKNSTFAELFEEKHPDRFIQCFIAEQNMVGMSVGLDRRGFIPYVSTFGAFFTRAFDQIRMAAIGTANLRLVGSHAGVSIGQDGPSQMALEDIGMMRSLPGSIVLYPCDAVSTYELVHQMLEYNQGISYLRTTRMGTPVIYDVNESFPIGGCKVLRQSKEDKVCVIGAGVTLFEALKAYDKLKDKGISISVIDLYSIKPLDEKTIIDVARKSGNKIITVEDHYLEGGLGQAVAYAVRNHDITIECLAVTALPRSGKPEELLAWAGIDANAIIKIVKKLG